VNTAAAWGGSPSSTQFFVIYLFESWFYYEISVQNHRHLFFTTVQYK
jgi:hypothetical protein